MSLDVHISTVSTNTLSRIHMTAGFLQENEIGEYFMGQVFTTLQLL